MTKLFMFYLIGCITAHQFLKEMYLADMNRLLLSHDAGQYEWTVFDTVACVIVSLLSWYLVYKIVNLKPC